MVVPLSMVPGLKTKSDLAAVAQRSRGCYAARVAGIPAAPPWWTAVVITASSARQAKRYQWEIHRREESGKIPANVRYLVVPDPPDQRIGSGGATLHAIRCLLTDAPTADLAGWWAAQRVFMIHAGGDSRQLPQYSLSGKLFSAVPVKTPWGDASSVFDEILALSTAWAERLPSGLVIGAGDVLLTFDADSVDWTRPGVSGVAILQPAEAGTRHGVYVADELGRVYAFLQKPSVAELQAAGGLLSGDQAALDAGLLCFSPDAAARLTQLAGMEHAEIDLYEHVTKCLTGQWKPDAADPPSLHALADALKGVSFWCSTVPGDFVHVGTTTVFRELMTRETEFSRLYAAQQRLGATRQAGLRSAGVVVDSVLTAGGDLGPATVVIECNLAGAVHAMSGSVLHGLDDIAGAVDVPENVVLHQVPVITGSGRHGTVIRVYGVEDDPKAGVKSGNATWFGRPILEELRTFGMDPAEVWPDMPEQEWSLWSASLFPIGTVAEAWNCARWLLRLGNEYSVERWRAQQRLSLDNSAQCCDPVAIETARVRRLKGHWRDLSLSLTAAGADVRPLLAHAPGIASLAEAGEGLRAQASTLAESAPTEAASRQYTAGLFFGQAGLAHESLECHQAAFELVERAVRAGSHARTLRTAPWQHEEVIVEGPARIDLGGGWSDTPPFCIDWGGSVLNVGVLLNGNYPIRTIVRRLRDLVVRCDAGENTGVAEYRTCAEIAQPAGPGDPFAIPRTALQMMGLVDEGISLPEVLARMGGGIEITTAVDLPMGSGLGTSSILAATTLSALTAMMGVAMEPQALSDQVMRLEQLMTTGGGWQDQAGGIFPGAKLVASGPGMHQRLRVQPVPWTAEREAEFERRTVLFYTGIRRVARDLLQQVVGSYLARETACVQVLHSIKTLALEMSYAMQEGDWDHLGELLNRHWELNKILDPNTTNAPINSLLESLRPFTSGIKLAGAGGGGFLILLARGDKVDELRQFLRNRARTSGGAIYDWRIARDGLRIMQR